MMDFLYGNLPEIVDPFAYEAESKDNTIDLQIDNDKRVISATVNKTPGKLCVYLDSKEVQYFDGSSDMQIHINTDYIVKRVTPDNGDIRAQYALLKYNNVTHQYELVGDTLYFEEQIDELNIENGSLDENVDSLKVSNGNGGITSVLYKSKETINAITQLKSNGEVILSDDGMSHIVGLRKDSIVGGGTLTGVQSVAFGGLAYGLSDISLIVLRYNGKNYYYNIESEKPLKIKSIDDLIEILQSQSNIIRFKILSGSGIIENVDIDFVISWDEKTEKVKKIVSVIPNNTTVNIIRGFTQNTTATGNQSLSVGGGTQSNGNFSQAFGLGTKADEQGQTVIGTFNLPEKNAALIIGNGWFDIKTGEVHRSNALSIMRDGNIKIYDKVTGSADSLITLGVLDKSVLDLNKKIIYNKEQIQINGSLIDSMNNIKNGIGVGSVQSSSLNDDDRPYTEDEFPIASGHESIAFGKKVKATGKRSVAIGNGNTSSGNTSFTIGQLNDNSGNASLVTGYKNINSGTQTFVNGANNEVSATCSTVLGYGNKILNGNYILVSGYALKTVENSGTKSVFGVWNDPKFNTLLEVGNGKNTESTRSNAFEVLKDGRAKVYGAPIDDNDTIRKIEVDNLTSYVDDQDKVNATNISNLNNKVSTAIDTYLNTQGVLILDDGCLG